MQAHAIRDPNACISLSFSVRDRAFLEGCVNKSESGDSASSIDQREFSQVMASIWPIRIDDDDDRAAVVR